MDNLKGLQANAETGPSSKPQPAKEQTRQHFRSLRSALTEDQRQQAAVGLSRGIGTVLQGVDGNAAGGTVAAYLSVGSEPGTSPLLEVLTEGGYDVVVPVCEPRYQLSWVRWWPGAELAPSTRSWVHEPVGQRFRFEELEGARLILVPGLVLDEHGHRMGQGGGYYDRFLADVYRQAGVDNTSPGARPLTVGVAHDHEVVAAGTFACDPHDMPLDGILTPERFFWIKAA